MRGIMIGWRSLRIRIAAVIVVLTLVLGLGGTARARADLTRIGRMELEKRGATIARDLAVQHADQILVNDIYTLYTLVNDFLLNNADLRYIFILDAQGKVIVNSFPDGLPVGLRQANVPPSDNTYQVRRLRTTEGVVYDIAMPVAGGRAGGVRVGMLEAPLWEQVNQQTLGLLIMTGAVTLLGAAAGFVLWRGNRWRQRCPRQWVRRSHSSPRRPTATATWCGSISASLSGQPVPRSIPTSRATGIPRDDWPAFGRRR